MEDYDLESRGKFLLSPPNGDTHWSVATTGANAASRATLGLEALYAAVNAGRKQGRPLEGAVSPSPCSRSGSIPTVDARNETANELAKQGGGVTGVVPLTSRVSAASLATMPLIGHRYRCVATIGTGTFAVVIRADDTFRQRRSVAIKVMDLSCEAIGIHEVRCMRFLNSLPHSEFRPVVKLLDVLTFSGHLCLVMELLEGTLLPYTLRAATGRREEFAPPMRDEGRGGDRGLPCSGVDTHVAESASTTKRLLRESIWGVSSVGNTELVEDGSMGSSAGLPTCVLRHVALQLVSALLLLHNHGLIHADIKPQNVLLRIDGHEETAGGKGALPLRLEDFMNGRAGTGVHWGVCSSARLTVKLCDFGNAIHRTETCRYYDDFDIQSLAYRAPEVLMGCPFGPAIDTWSAGVMLLELLLGRPLFHTASSRAALLRQTLCAFGPLPLRRFRVGRYYSEYFAQDQSLKVSISNPEGDSRLGCCPCCWMGDRSRLDMEGQAQLASTPCDGSCAERCRLPDMRKGSSGGKQGTGIATTAPPLAARRGSSFPGSARRTDAPVTRESCGWMTARAHLCRLVSAASAAAPVVQGAERAASSAGGYGSSASSAARRNPRLLSLLAGLLCLNPDERLTPVQALAHPFFGEVLPFAIPLAAEAGTQKVELPPTASALANRLDSMVAMTRTRETPAYVGEGGRRGQGSKWGSMLMSDGVLAQPPAAVARSTKPQEASRLCDSNGANDDDKAQVDHQRRNSRSTADLPATARSWAPSCPDIVSASGTPSFLTSAGGTDATEVVGTTSQILHLAEMAADMAIKRDAYASRSRGDCRSDTSRVALPPPRRNRFLDASFPPSLAPRDGVSRVQARCEPAAPAESGVSAQRAGIEPTTPPAADLARLKGRVTVPGQRQPNRFLSPSTLAKLNPDLRGKGKDTTTAIRARHTAETVLAVGVGETAPVKTPSKRALAATSHEADQTYTPKKSARVSQQESQEVLRPRGSFHGHEPAARTRSQRRASSADDRRRAENGQTSRAVEVGRTATPRRRAAVAAGVALSRLREDDAESGDVS